MKHIVYCKSGNSAILYLKNSKRLGEEFVYEFTTCAGEAHDLFFEQSARSCASVLNDLTGGAFVAGQVSA